MTTKYYIVVSPVLMGKYIQDEIISAQEVGARLDKYVSRGALREMSVEEAATVEAAKYRTFVLPPPITTEKFATWIVGVTLVFQEDLKGHEFPYSGGMIIVGPCHQLLKPQASFYGYIEPELTAFGLDDAALDEFRRSESFSFYTLDLSTGGAKLQLRGGTGCLADYVHELIAAMYIRWPELEEDSEFEQLMNVSDAANGAAPEPEQVADRVSADRDGGPADASLVAQENARLYRDSLIIELRFGCKLMAKEIEIVLKKEFSGSRWDNKVKMHVGQRTIRNVWREHAATYPRELRM